MRKLVLFVTAHDDRTRLEWEERFVGRILEFVDGASVYEGSGAYRLKDGSVIFEPHSRIEVYAKEAHTIQRLYANLYPLVLKYLADARQEAMLVMMNDEMSFVSLE